MRKFLLIIKTGLISINPVFWLKKTPVLLSKTYQIIRNFNYLELFSNIVRFFKDQNHRENWFKIHKSVKHNLVPEYAEAEPIRPYAWKEFGWTKHLGLVFLVLIIWFGNFITSRATNSFAYQDYQTSGLVDTAAVSKEDLEKTISLVMKYTPIVTGNPKAIAAKLTGEEEVILTSGNYILKPKIVEAKPSILLAKARQEEQAGSGQRDTLITYTVVDGDTIGAIAEKFSITIATIKSINGLSDDIIKPDQTLTIPSVNGYIYTVEEGDTLIGVVSKFNGNLQDTIFTNKLSGADRIYIGQKLLIAGGSAPAPTATAVASASQSQTSSASAYTAPSVAGISVNRGTGSNSYPYGWCTWYVASKRYIPWKGNANQWPYQAQAYGYSVGRVPVPGAIMVTGESWWGHVAYVESVSGGSVTISEMNYAGWGRISSRTVSAGYGVYIY